MNALMGVCVCVCLPFWAQHHKAIRWIGENENGLMLRDGSVRVGRFMQAEKNLRHRRRRRQHYNRRLGQEKQQNK